MIQGLFFPQVILVYGLKIVDFSYSPALLLTIVSPVFPVSKSAWIKFSGIPQRPVKIEKK
jgi:hypothetical protein